MSTADEGARSVSGRAIRASARGPERPSALRRPWLALSAALAAALALLPHVLHHAGPLAGAALFAGAAGSLLFGAVGFIAAVPFLLRVRRRCGNWRVPGALITAMVAAFSVSTLVVAPAVVGGDGEDRGTATESPLPAEAPADRKPSGHDGHH